MADLGARGAGGSFSGASTAATTAVGLPSSVASVKKVSLAGGIDTLYTAAAFAAGDRLTATTLIPSINGSLGAPRAMTGTLQP